MTKPSTLEEAIQAAIESLGGYERLDEKIEPPYLKLAFHKSIPSELRKQSPLLMDDKLYSRWLDQQVAAAYYRQAADEYEINAAIGKPVEIIDARTSIVATQGDHVPGPPVVRPLPSGALQKIGELPGYTVMLVDDRGPLDVVVTIRRDDRMATDDIRLEVRTTLPGFLGRRMGIVPADHPALTDDLPAFAGTPGQAH